MTKDEYAAYRETARWKFISRTVRQIEKKCQRCGFPYELDVHHKTYKNLGRENLDDLIVLCKSCHAREHFVDDLDKIPDELFWGNKSESANKIKRQQREARIKNADRAEEIEENKRHEDE